MYHKELLDRIKEGKPTQENHHPPPPPKKAGRGGRKIPPKWKILQGGSGSLDRDRYPELNRIKTQFADMRKVGNTDTPGTQDRTGGRGDVRGAEGNLRLETVQMSRNHALAKESDENSEGRTGMGTPKRKLDNQEGELFFSPAKRMNLNMHFEVDFETWTHE